MERKIVRDHLHPELEPDESFTILPILSGKGGLYCYVNVETEGELVRMRFRWNSKLRQPKRTDGIYAHIRKEFLETIIAEVTQAFLADDRIPRA